MDQITGDKKKVTPKVKRDCKEGKAKALRGKRGRAERPKKSKVLLLD